MKYIIEIKPEYEDSFKGLMILGAKDSDLFVDTLGVENLEELNSDYISEHYSDLQDDAYERGHGIGYQKGFEDGKAVNDKGCEGCKYEGGTAGRNPCFSCSNYYQNYWMAEDDKIEAGDIVERYLNGKLDSTGIYLGENDGHYNCLFWTGTVFGTFAYPKNQFKKTGRHFDIASILKEMQS